jgi:DNA-binding SARP family transcriptional activator/class 3 adenylate cyclase
MPVRAGQRFCHECGARLTADGDEAGERRLLTAVQCRPLGSPLEVASEEEVHEVMTRFLHLASAEVQRFGGAIVDRIGRGVLALVGVPVAHEDHARRAVLAGLALQKAVAREWPGGGGAELRIGIGVSTGEAVVGTAGSRILNAVGAPIDEAARLAERAAPGEVLIGAATEEAVRGYVVCRPLGTAGGGDDAASAFAVTGRGRRVSRLDRPDRRVTRFVGRQRQLTALGELLDEARAGRGQVVGVAAEAGMGKSRLVAEFLSRAARDVRAREGRCLSYASATPFVPIADLVRAQTGLGGSDSADGVLTALGRRLGALGLDPVRHAPYLANLLGSREGDEVLRDRSPEAVRETTFESLVALFVAEAAEAPTIVLIEDLHWVDAVSQDAIGRFVENLPGRRVMLLCTYRPGFRAPWMGVSYSTQIALPPLSSEASREVVESIVGELPVSPEIMDAVVVRADGNPFFLEELSYAVAGGALGEGVVPATVHDVLMARIDQLDPSPRRLLRTASVLGREFPRALLAEIWPGEGDLDTHLEELRRREFLYEEDGGRERTLLFRHALTHDVAYSGLLAGRRRELHRAAGEALERMHAERPEEAYARLGYHFSRAGEDAKAVTYLALAADRALQVYSNESAAEELELALRHVEQVDDPALRRQAPQLVFRLAFTLYLLGRFRDALERLQSPLAHPGADEPQLIAEHDFWLAYFHTHLGNSEAAHRHAERAIAAADRLGDRFTAGRAHYVLTREDFWLCRYAQGVENGRRAVELLESSDEWWWWLGHASSWKGLCHYNRGEFEEALRDCRRMNAIGGEHDDPRLQSYSDWNLGWIEATRGNAATGILHCTRSLQRSPDPLNSAYSTGWLGFSYRESGDHAQAVSHLERAISALRRFGYTRLVGWFGTWLADAYLWAGRREDARRTAAESLEVSKEVAYPWAIAVGTRARGRIAEADGDLEGAARLMSEALGQFAGIDAAFDAAATRLDLARVAARRGDGQAARTEVAAALSAFETMAAPVYAERARTMLDGLTGAATDRAAGSSAAAESGPPLRVRSLGGFEVYRGSAPLDIEELGGERGRELLAALLAVRAPVHRDRLIAWLWPRSTPDRAGESLREAAEALGRALGPDRAAVEGLSHRVTLVGGDEWDVCELLRIAAGPGKAEISVAALESALTAYAAPLFPEWPDAEWARPLRRECAQALTRLRGRLAEALLEAERSDAALVHFAQLVEVEPEEEAWHRGLMRCHARTGDTALALRQFHACRSVLRQARGADPSAETQALYLELLARR